MRHSIFLRFLLTIFLGVLGQGVSLLDATNAVLQAGEPVRVREISLPDQPYRYDDVLPPHFRQAADRFDNTPTHNPITDGGATLGRVLFYDPSLSINGTTSCASCHKQQYAFTDERQRSVGFDGQQVDRNSMSLINSRYYRGGRFFWDERAETLEKQVLMPIKNEIEMGHQLDRLVTQLSADPLYPPLFESAFGSTEVTSQRIARALAQFVRSIVSYRSRYDVGRGRVERATDRFPNFTDQENLGKTQFFGRGNCASCHLADDTDQTPRQSAFFFVEKPVVNGIDSDDAGINHDRPDIDRPDIDRGLGSFTGKKSDFGKFKAPSLRNVELTAPYMHDGRFRTLDQVLEHYNWSVRPHPNLDSRLQDFADNGMALPEVEKVALAAFLKTLTDVALVNDKRFSDPFVKTASE